MKVVLAGATGLVGGEVQELLLKDSSFSKITVYSRKPLEQSHPRLKVILGNLDELKSHQDELQGDVFISCLGTTIKKAGSKESFRKVDFDGVVELGQTAKANGAKKFILVSAQGANSDSLFFYPRVKGEVEKALEDLGLPALTIFRPALLVGERDDKRMAEEIAIKAYRLISPFLPNTVKQKIGTEVSRLAEQIVGEAKDFSAGVNIRSPQDI